MTRILPAFVAAVLTVVGCAGGDPASAPAQPQPSARCVDEDGDGRGDGCDAGTDCDDQDPSAGETCKRCAQADTGCACTPGAQPQGCFLEKTEDSEGNVMCHEGTRYCREGAWSACEDVHTYPLPEREGQAALIDVDAGAVQCNDCSINCFRVSDNLDPVTGGLNDGNSTGTAFVPGGGLTLGKRDLDAAVDEEEPPYDPSMCMIGVAPDIDCDGIPDQYDPFPEDPPFATANPGIFLDIGPGETGTGVIDLDFFINSADVYFLIDQSASMTDERDNLKADLVTGDFIADENYDCADVNLNHIADDNDLKAQGIVGAIKCIIRDANFGVGFHREIPFTDYADNKQIAYDNYQDITDDVDDMIAGVNRLDTIGNIDWPEASMLALHNVVTGNGMYFGTTKRGIPPRTDCPAGTWGYPCFRSEAIPIVILITDAMMHNGPNSNRFPYTASKLGLTRGTAAQYYPLGTSYESFSTAYNAGDLTSTVKTFTGDTTNMTSAIDRSTLSCLTQNGGADAFVRFDLTQARTVRISSEGSRYDTVLGLYAGQPQAATMLPASSNTNETGATATSLGNITGASVSITGNTSAMASNYDWSTVQCNADPAARDAVYSFTLSAPTNVDISTVGSSFDTVVSLHSAAPPTAPTYTASSNTNESLETAQSMGAAYNSVLAYSGSTSGRTANYQGAELGCGADNTSPDVAYRFTLAQPTRVRVSTEGSAYDTVIGLIGDSCGGTPSTPPTPTDTSGSNATTGFSHTFGVGSLVIPMGATYQSAAMLRAYGLVYALLKADIPVSWVIKKNKVSGEADFTASATNYLNAALTITNHGYRGGPFVVDSTDATRAAATINAYLTTNPTVVVHRTTTSFDALVRRQLSGAPRFALMLDGSEAIARTYLAAAGITDSQSTAFPDSASDTLTLAELAGASTSAFDGSLFDGSGTPRFCGLISTGWPAASATTASGVEAVRETRQFLESATSLFAQGQSALSFEDSVGGAFLTRNGYDAGGAITNLFEQNIDSPYAQIDGALSSSGGAVPSLALPSPDDYRDGDATIYGKQDGAIGEADLWVTARLDGECSILNESCEAGQALGKVSYLGGSATYNTVAPASVNGARLFLNALFAADCNLREQKPSPTISLTGNTVSTAAQVTYTITYNNDGEGVAHSAYVEYALPTGASYVSSTGGGSFASGKVTWTLPSLSPDETGSFTVTVQYPSFASYANQATIFYTQGNTTRSQASWVVTTSYTNATDLQCTALGVNNTTIAGTSHETQATAYAIGEVAGRIHRLTGTTAGMTGNYTTAETGSTCNAATAGPDAIYSFTLGQAANVTVSTEGTTGWDTTLALYGGALSPSESVSTNNANETTSAPTALGPVNGKRLVVSGGTTQSMTANYSTDEVGCTADAASPDAVYSFTLTSPTTVRLNTIGSSFDTVLSVHSAPIVQPNAPVTTAIASNTNDRTQSAYPFPLAVNGRDQIITANSSSLSAQYQLPSSCYNLSGVESFFGGGSSSGVDAVFSFDVTSNGTFDINTNGSSPDTTLAIYPNPARFTALPVDDIGDDDASRTGAWPGGAINQSVINVAGNTSNNSQSAWMVENCNAHHNARDAFVAFSVTGASNRTITFDTTGSSFDTVIMVNRYTNAAQTTWTQEACNDDAPGYGSASYISRSLAPGNYFVVITGDGNNDAGDYNLRIADSSTSSNLTACNDDGGSDGSDGRLAAQALTTGSYYAIVKNVFGFNLGSAAYQLQIRDTNISSSGMSNRIDCNDDASGTASQLDLALGIGTYYVVVKGGASTARGTYALTVEDLLTPPTGNLLECDDNDGPSGSSIISRALTAGTYYVALKGKTASASGAYTLRVLDQNASVGTVIECNDDGGVDNSSVIERDLAAGSYYVIVKGDNAGEGGNYKLSVRDVTNQGYRFLQCDDDGAAAQTSRITRDLAAGTYYAVVKGDAASNAGAYSLTVQDTANSPLGAIACNDDGGTYKTSVISRSLSAGTYYVALKGYSATEKGRYQLTIGGGSTASGFYVPPTWAQTLTALNDRGVRVIPILSCHDDPDHGDVDGDCEDTREQATALANSTGALGVSLEPLVFDIDRDGDGLSRSVVDGVASLAEYLEMDVRVIVKFDPDANPGFMVNITAVDEIGDGCTGLIGSEHQNCAPGATPRFNIAFTNPLPGVPRHPTDPNGGYTFRAQLIGDDQFIVEEVPIYIIPESLEPPGPEEPPIYEEGSYWQDTASPGCAAINQAPDWRDLSWDADVYDNTTISFMACTSGTAEGLNSCVPKEIASVTGAGDCSTDADCEVGYCDTGIGVCQVARVGTCTSDMQCGVNSYCDLEVEQCTYRRQPVYIGASLGTDNLQRFLRMTINLSVTEPYEEPPVLHRWDMTYYCNNAL